ncbi:MAG: DedA family protein [Patescibacteria group bacterium]|jgi:membrane protein DedA with SNARE-associated domain|nr:DedA family protein [bacterium]HQC49880.1 DedA family protein [bacterium]
MLSEFFNFLLSITANLGYWGVGILMAIESSFIPMPSEIIVPPAAYLASLGKMNIWLIIIAGVLGSVVGAIFNYVIGYYLGRPLVYKLAAHPFAKFLLINPEKIKKAEKYFFDNATSATFIGRLIPVIRQLISIPAGFSKMPFGPFVFYTALGSTIWVSILAALGYFIGANQELLARYYKEIIWVLFIFGVLWFGWKFFQTINKKNSV